MDVKLGRFLTEDERKAMGDASVARGGYRNGVDAGFVPGTGWFTPWVFDPAGHPRRHTMIKGRDSPDAGYLIAALLARLGTYQTTDLDRRTWRRRMGNRP